MKPIFDSQGDTVAWLKEDRILDLDGYSVALVRGKTVLTYTGLQVGNFSNGIFRDSQGDAVAWIRGAVGGPQRPVANVPPEPPPPDAPPEPPELPEPWEPPAPSLSWSNKKWIQFIADKQ